MKIGNSIGKRILVTATGVVILLSLILVSVMTYFMNSLTDSILMDTLQPMAKTAASSVQGNLHLLADKIFITRDNYVFVNPAAGEEDKRAVLTRTQGGIEFVWLGLYTAEGELEVGGENCPPSIKDWYLFSMMRDTANLAIEDTLNGPEGLQIVMGAPILNRGRITGFLVGSYRYDILNDVLSNINIGAGSTAFIINEEGKLMAHRDVEKVRRGESLLDISSASVHELLSKMSRGETGSLKVDDFSSRHFFCYAPVRGTRWSLAIQTPRSDFSSAASQAIFISIYVTLFLLFLFIFVFTFFLKDTLTEPLRLITMNAHRVALGQFIRKLPDHLVGREDEIGQLGDAFVSMSDSIEGVINDIELITRAARAGNLGVRVDLFALYGDYDRIIGGVNTTLDVICSQLDAVPEALAFFNESRKMLYHNRAMARFLVRHGLSATDGKLLERIVASGPSGEFSSEAASLFEPVGATSAMYSADITLPVPDGRFNYTLSLRRTGSGQETDGGAEAVLDGTGEAVCVMMILSDVTLLTKARDDAQMASRAKSDFLANMSHEMRTPMNAIIGMTNIAKSSSDVERKNYCLEKIDEASNHLLGVINDILDMSKIEANKFELSFAEFDFEKMLQKVVGVVSFRVDEKRQNFSVTIDKDIPRILVGDDQRLAQVIANLLSNAVKFTPEEGELCLEAKFTGETDGVCGLRITVSDTGIGISAEQQNKLFTSFEQADGSISRKFGGTGLGLAISKRIVEMMGGRIWVESQLGKGSHFIFTLEAKRGEDTQFCPLAPGVNRQTVRVLAVDDAPEIREYVGELMQRLGISCDLAGSGDEACALIGKNGPYDIYFVDWKMPGMSGIELSRRIKSGEGGHSVVIMISATEWSHIEDEAKSAGVDKFIQKPLFPSAIADCINECLGSSDEAVSPPEEEADNLEGYRIILAEDVAINREIVLSVLEPTGLLIDCAESGREALELFSASPEKYNMIFMDVHMPEMDGYEATRRIRALALAEAKTIPIVAMTANVFREDIEKCLAAGMNDHIGKPIDFDEVFTKLKRYLAKQ
ncbi:MAG: response regulator [Spirochaetales bacterium]|nr:response regulator [Spirochaetales bacterium]